MTDEFHHSFYLHMRHQLPIKCHLILIVEHIVSFNMSANESLIHFLMFSNNDDWDFLGWWFVDTCDELKVWTLVIATAVHNESCAVTIWRTRPKNMSGQPVKLHIFCRISHWLVYWVCKCKQILKKYFTAGKTSLFINLGCLCSRNMQIFLKSMAPVTTISFYN